MNETVNQLRTIAAEFGEIAKKVNESSKKRKEYTDSSLTEIARVQELHKSLITEIGSVAESNVTHRDRDNIILNNSRIVRSNLSRQKAIIEELKSSGTLDGENYKKITEIIGAVEQGLAEATENLESIIRADNEIILLDKILTALKKSQQKSIRILHQVTGVALDDAERAIEGSASNLDRGLKFAEKFNGIDDLVKAKDAKGLELLANEAKTGQEMARKVHESSLSQLTFAEKVNSFTKEFHQDALKIQELVKHKHHLFEQNLQTITVLTVITTMKIQKYTTIAEILEKIEPKAADRSVYSELVAITELAISDIRDIGAMNYDNTDSLELNNRVEHKTVDWTNEEIGIYTNIKNNVESMTTATAYPIEGSSLNIENGKKIETLLRDMIGRL